MFYDDATTLDSLKLIRPILTLEDGAAGSLEFTMTKGNPCYDTILLMKTEIVVKKRDAEIWSGRAVAESYDFYGRRSLTCEGELAYLNDTCQPPIEFNRALPGAFLQRILTQHNEKVPSNKQFLAGYDGLSGSVTCVTDYENTLELINNKLVNDLEGHVVIRKENGVRYIDLYDLEDSPSPSTNTQTINFGENLLDFAKSFDMTDMATVIVPLGAMLEDPPEDEPEIYTTVKSVNNGSIYVYSNEAVERFGWIEKVVHWDHIGDPGTLLALARTHLRSGQFDRLKLEVSAYDLNYINSEIQSIRLLDNIRVVSAPHGLDRVFMVRKQIIHLDDPENTVYTFGADNSRTFTEYVRETKK